MQLEFGQNTFITREDIQMATIHMKGVQHH